MLEKYFRLRSGFGLFVFILGLICLLLMAMNVGVISEGKHRWISKTMKIAGLITGFFFCVFSAFAFGEMYLGEIKKLYPTLGLTFYGIMLAIGYTGIQIIEPPKSSFLGDFIVEVITIGWPLVCVIDLAMTLYAEKKGA